MSARDDYVEKYKARLDQLNAEIDKLEARAREADADARIQYRKHLDEARAKRDEAKAKLGELRSASDGAWEDLKRGVRDSWDAASAAVKNAVARFR